MFLKFCNKFNLIIKHIYILTFWTTQKNLSLNNETKMPLCEFEQVAQNKLENIRKLAIKQLEKVEEILK